jgi:transmembrane E3 ubiquitin-protein ligase
MADRRSSVIPLLIIGWIIFSGPARPPASRFEDRRSVEGVIADEQRSLDVLRNSTWGDLGGQDGRTLNLNLTGLEPDRGYAWDALPVVKNRAQEQLTYALGEEGKQMLEGAGGSAALYHNVTGFVHGEWVRSKIQDSVHSPLLNLSTYATGGPFGQSAPRPFGRNVTGTHGDLRLRFRERPQHDGIRRAVNITGISAEMAIQDEDTGEELELQAYGVYHMDLGEAILTTTSEKFAGYFMLPHFSLSERTFNTSFALLNESIPRIIKAQQEGTVDVLNPWSSRTETLETTYDEANCELIVYLQQLPPASATATYSSSLLGFLEREIRLPTGAFLPPVPELRFSMLAFSPDCGYVLESKGEPDYVPQEGGKHLIGPKIEVLMRNGRHHLLVFTLTIGAQLYLLMRQMREASTPSTRSRISWYSIAMLALGDGFAAISFVMLSILITDVWVNLSSAAFLALISVSFFGMRFIMDIWSVQAPEREARAREEAEEERQRLERFQAALQRIRSERQAALAAAAARESAGQGEQLTATQTTPAISQDQPPAPAALPTQTMPGSLPLPVTAPRPTDTGATPVFFMPSDQEGLEPIVPPRTTTGEPNDPIQVEPRMPTFASLYIRFYLLLLIILFLSSAAASWPSPFRKGYFTLHGLAYLSFWIPQIWRNVWRNCRHALNWEFVLGQSLLRLVPFAYFFGYEHNILFAGKDYSALMFLATWVWIQVVVLASQEVIGPRWFIKSSWAPPAYDYHPILREDEEGATMPIGLSAATATDTAPGSPVLDRTTSPTTPRRGSMAKDTKSKQKGKRVFDCAICMQDLEVPVVEAGSREGSLGSGAGGGGFTAGAGGFTLARRNYMVTPCRHIFHSACLEGWMKYRLQCPICREGLPPL